MESPSFLNRGVVVLILALAVLLPIFVIPWNPIGLGVSKAVLITGILLLATIVWLLQVLRDGVIEVPRTWLIWSAALVIIATFIAALTSELPSLSLIGRGIEYGTFLSIALALLPVVLIPIAIRRETDIFRIHTGVFLAIVLVALFQLLRLVVGPDAMTLGVFTSSVANLIGKWNDLGIFFGLGAILSSLAIEFYTPPKRFKVFLYILLALSLFFVVLVNFSTLWYVLGVLGFVLLIYRLSLPAPRSMESLGSESEVGNEQPRIRRTVSVIGIIFIVLAVLFSLANTNVGTLLSNVFGISQIEVRPSWEATFDVADATLSEDPIFGAGPARFNTAWQMHKPDGVNESLFWNIDFNAGVGLIPSSLVTTGILGFASWLVFLGLFLFYGIRAIFNTGASPLVRYLTIGSFIGALYLWVFATVYIPSLLLVVLAGIFTGLFIASAMAQGSIRRRSLEFATRPAWNFLTVLVTVALIIASGAALFLFGERVSAHIIHERALQSFAETGDIEAARDSVGRAVTIHEYDRYYRSLVEIEIVRLRNIVARGSVGETDLAEFQSVLGNAIASARRATELDPENHQNWVSLGNVYAAVIPLQIEGAYDNARAAYEQASAVSPHNPQIYLTQAQLEATQGDFDGARTLVARAIEEKGNYLDAVFFLSQIEVAEGNIAQAVRTAEAAAVLAPNDPLVFFRLGLLYYNQPNMQNAILAFERAVSLTPVYANARYFLGLAYEAVGRDQDAITQFEAVAETNPDNQEVQFILENLRAGRRPFANAEAPLDEAPEDRETPPLPETE